MSAISKRRVSLSPAVLAVQLVLVVGVCGMLAWLPYLFTREETAITQYPAPKETFAKVPAKLPSVGEPARLWGAIVPLTSDVWFFKLTGPVEAVKALESDLSQFLQTVRFGKDEPTWTLPDGWQQKPGNEFRFATLIIPAGEKPLELAVSKLGRGGPWDAQLLVNVNRWREQLTLPPLKPEELTEATETLDVDGVTATIVNAVGIKKPDTMGRGPFMK